MSVILIIGGAGFLGSNLAKQLLEAGRSVRVLDRRGTASPLPSTLREQIDWREGDFCEPEDVTEALEGVEIVVHLASTTIPQTSNEHPIEDIQSNLVGSVRLMHAAHRANVRRFIFGSSGGTVYGPPQSTPIREDHTTNPVCSYGIVKLAIEKYLAIFHAEQGLEYVSLRVANPYGPYQRPNAAQGAVGVFLGRALSGKPIEIWGNGEVVRDFVHVSDVCRAFTAAIDGNPANAALNVGSGRGHSLNDLIAIIRNCLGVSIDVNYRASRSVDLPINVLDISRANEMIGWIPHISFEDGVRKTIDEILSGRPPH